MKFIQGLKWTLSVPHLDHFICQPVSQLFGNIVIGLKVSTHLKATTGVILHLLTTSCTLVPAKTSPSRPPRSLRWPLWRGSTVVNALLANQNKCFSLFTPLIPFFLRLLVLLISVLFFFRFIDIVKKR